MFGSEAKVESKEVGRRVAQFCSHLDPQTIGLADVPVVFDELAAMKKLVDGAVVRMTARYEEAGAWKRAGAKDVEDDVARRTGSSRGAAKRAAQTSRRLKSQPKTDEAVRDGKLSAEQADAITSGAEASPEDEDSLLESAAKDPLHETKTKAAQARARADKDREARRRRQHAMRRVSRWIDDDGLYNLLLKVTPEIGAEIDAVLKPLIDRAYADARDAGRMESYEAYAADVITDLLRAHYTTSHDTTTDDTTTGDTETPDVTDTGPDDHAGAVHHSDTAEADTAEAEPGERLPERSRNQAVRPDRKVIALIDANALNRGHVEGDETCEIAGVGPVSVTAIRSMLCDAFLTVVIRDGKDIRNITHIGRQATAHQRTALETRGYQCEVEGCGSTHHLDIDHVTGWTLTKTTSLDDLAWLCRHHHDRKTLEKLWLVGPPGRRKLVKPPDNADHPDDPGPQQFRLAF